MKMKFILMVLMSVCLLEGRYVGESLDVARICAGGYEFVSVKLRGGMTADSLNTIQVMEIKDNVPTPKKCKCEGKDG